jgi:formate dehydrogenase subunit delta
MDPHHLVKMANNIGDFFASEDDKSKAAKGVADHIQSFWEPRMRREIFRYLDEQGGAGLQELVLTPLRERRAQLTPTPRN